MKNGLNPYQPPHDSPLECPAVLEIDRSFLFDEEIGEGFLLDWGFLRQSIHYSEFAIENARHVVERPRVVFSDLKRENHSKSFCYCGRPGEYLIEQGQGGEVKTGYVLLAYATLDENFGKVVVFNLNLRLEHQGRQGYPVNYRDDFGDEVLYERN